MNKKAQSFSTVAGLVFGITSLIIGVIIAFVIVSQVGAIDDEIYTAISGANVINETVTGASATDGDVLAKFGTMNSVECTAVEVLNSSNAVVIPTANYSLGKTTCNLNFTATSLGAIGYNVKVTYGWTYRATAGAGANMQTNFTKAVDNVSKYVPTVLLVAAIVLILSILAVLVAVWQRMRMGGDGI